MDLKKEQQILLSKQRIKYIEHCVAFHDVLSCFTAYRKYRFWDTFLTESVLGNLLVSFRMPNVFLY